MVEPVMIESDEYQQMWNFIVFLDLPSSTGANNADLDKFKVNSWVLKYWAFFSGVTLTAEVAYSLKFVLFMIETLVLGIT